MQNQRLDAILESYVAVGDETKDKLLGAAFCVVNKDGVLYQGSAGRIDLPVHSAPFTTQSFTWVASMTKIITAAAVMQEVERGTLSLDQDMRPLVPQLAQMEILRGFEETDGKPVLEPNADPITMRHLLTHTAGLGYDAADPELTRWSKAVGRTASAFDFSLDGFATPLRFPPGEGWWYGSALDWAAEAVAAAASVRRGAKTRLADLVQEGILDPLGMRSTSFYSLRVDDELQRNKVASSYRDPETGKLSIGPPPIPAEPSIQSGGGGLWMTCEDFSKFLRAFLVSSLPEAGADAAGRILKSETVAEMLRPQLGDRQREALQSVTGEAHDSMVPEFEKTTPLDHGISGIINLADVPSKRKAGSMMWKGFTNGQWWVDPTAGIAAALFVSVLPQPDPVLTKLHDELERAVYSDLI
ncbi:hypothetical protein RB595_008653 [Gaeumannomyces hyphopodioides]